jgi:NAD(P)-dependent dehydrogenase (short-subunit alcohol dehydrogenase family)
MCAAVVTGGATRIGRQICITLSRLNIPVVIHCNSSVGPAHQLAESIIKDGGLAKVIRHDLNSDDTSDFFRECQSCFGTVKFLVNNASVFDHDNSRTITTPLFDRTLNVNLRAPVLLCCDMFKQLNNSSKSFKQTTEYPLPCIVNILDQKVASTNGDNLSYTVSKHALHSVTEMLARDFAPVLRVNAVAPGPILANYRQTDEEFQICQQDCPLGAGPSVQDVADAVMYLINARSVTGQTIYVDGGIRFKSRSTDH